MCYIITRGVIRMPPYRTNKRLRHLLVTATLNLYVHCPFRTLFFGLFFLSHRCKLSRYRRISKAKQAGAGYVRRTINSVEQAYNRKTSATVFKFPATTSSLPGSATGEVELQLSASSSYRESRLTVTVKTKLNDPASCAVSCSGRGCQQ